MCTYIHTKYMYSFTGFWDYGSAGEDCNLIDFF